MQTIEKIKEEIAFQERQYDKRVALSKATSFELNRQVEIEIAGRHAARREALLWVIFENIKPRHL